jgi:hypothetical protein
MEENLKRLLSACLVVMLAGCTALGTTQQISAAPTPVPIVKPIATDLTQTAINLNCAVSIGILQPTDPAVGCVNSALAASNLPAVTCSGGVATVGVPATTTVPSFTATNAGLASAGSISYIKLAQQQARTPVTISPACKQLLGQFVVDAATAAANPVGTSETLLGIPQIH